MKGLIKNNGAPVFIFKRKFSSGHVVELEELWRLYRDKAKKELKGVITEDIFVGWLKKHNYMMEEFVYIPAENAASSVLEATPSDEGAPIPPMVERGIVPGDTSIARMRPKALSKFTYKDLASLRLADDPKRVVETITSVATLRRAYQLVRKMPRKRRLEKILRERIADLEHR